MKTKYRFIAALCAVMLCMTAFSVTAFAKGDDPEPVEIIEEPATEPEETTGGYEPEPLTPEGNMSLVDDISGEASGDKQFITVVSKNGNYFYIIIDNSSDGENTVHFLNQVDERDLLALMEDEEIETGAVATCVCTDKCVAGNVNTDCPICSVNMTECTGKEAIAADSELDAAGDEALPEPEATSSGNGALIMLVVIIILGGGAAAYFFKFRKKKPDTKGATDLDDYDYGDEDEDDEPDDDEDYYDAEAEPLDDTEREAEDQGEPSPTAPRRDG